MSELIDRERFSADMRDFQNRVGIWRDEAEDTETRTRADAALATIIETKLILDKQPTIAAPRWHRVEERLPGDSRDVIIFTASRIVGVGSFIKPNWYEWYSGGGLPVDVTHWMEKPEPPKEGNQ